MLVALSGAIAAAALSDCSRREQVTPQQRMVAESQVMGQIGIPVYPGTVTVEGYVTNGKGGRNIRALFLSTSDPITKVAAFYKSRVPKGSKESVLLQGDSGTANFTFEQGRTEKQITLSTGDNATQIELLSISPATKKVSGG